MGYGINKFNALGRPSRAYLQSFLRSTGTYNWQWTSKNFFGHQSVPFQHPEIPVETRHFINGEFVQGQSSTFIEALDPYTRQVLTKVPEASVEDVNRAVDAAEKAFERSTQYSQSYRRDCLLKLADLVELHQDRLAELESINSGKPISGIKIVDLKMIADVCRYAAGWIDKLPGEVRELAPTTGGNVLHFKIKEPVGVVAQIVPWNFPLMMLAYKIVFAFAAGCPTVVKTSEKTPLSALSFCYLLQKAGIPNGFINIISGRGSTTGEALVRHPKISKVAVTGSTETGKKVSIAAIESGLKRVSCELGGKSPLIVFSDADLELAINEANKGLFFNMGQCCMAASRIFVQDTIYDEFVRKVTGFAKQSVIGSPLNPSTTQGPQIDEIQYSKVVNYINSGIQEGASLQIGGIPQDSESLCVPYTVFSDVNDNMKIAKEEIFGPVMSILKFSTMEEVINRSNATAYGLASAVFTKDFEKAYYVMKKLKSGNVFMNGYNLFDPSICFGGYKESGVGRELGIEGIEAYLETKCAILNLTKNFKADS